MNKRLRNNLPLFFFVLMLISVSSEIYGQENHVSLLLKNVTLTRVLQDFSAETHIRLVYASSLTDSIRITAKTDDTPILALKKILRGTGFDFLRQSKDLWILVPKAATRKEPATLQGKVIDSTTQEPVPSATALLKYSQFGGTTDSTGFFTLENIPPGRYSLVVQRIGYVQFEQHIHFTGNDYFERLISLQPSPLPMPEISIEETGDHPQDEIRLAKQSISARQMAIPPLLNEGDAFALIHHMPGVSGRDPDDIFPHIEGGSAAEMAVEIDGIPVFVPTYGHNRRSLFATQLLENIAIERAGYDATHGEALTGIVALKTATVQENRPRFQVGVHTQGFSLGGQIEKKAVTWLIFTRQTALRNDENAIEEQVADVTQKFIWNASKRQRFEFLSLLGRGAFTRSNSVATPELLNANTGLMYNLALSQTSQFSLLLYNSLLQKTAQETGVKIDLTTSLSPALQWRSGLHAFHMHSRGDALADTLLQYKFTLPEFVDYAQLSENLFRQDLQLATVFSQIHWQHSGWDIVAGLRVPWLQKTRRLFYAPRLHIGYSPKEFLHLQLNGGRYVQFADRSYASEAKSGDDFGQGEYIATTSNDNPALANHLRFESTINLPQGWAFSAAVYAKQYEFHSRMIHTRLNRVSWLLPLDHGKSRGLQAFVTKTVGPVQGWLSYTRNRTQYFSKDGTGFVPYFQRNNIVQMALSNYVSAALQMRWHYAKYSGYPERL
ncbi:carboxypeptidase-like regulatory domain-containing protein, partial [candidate division KSB1 bacterium]|nr:carboxypeptidase-like regulatory domain-containing protein [candidate division KSB1 bacterium]